MKPAMKNKRALKMAWKVNNFNPQRLKFTDKKNKT